MVIELDLRQQKRPDSKGLGNGKVGPAMPNSLLALKAYGDTRSQPKVEQNPALKILLAPSQEDVSLSPKAKVGESIIEISHLDQSLSPALQKILQNIYKKSKKAQQGELLALAKKTLSMSYAQPSARLLNQIDLEQLSENQLGDYFEVRAEVQLKLGDSFGALVWLHQAQVLSPSTDPLTRIKRLTLKAQAYEANGLSLATAKALITLSQLPNTLNAEQYNERIWSALTKISFHTLSKSVTSPDSDVARAWYQLALVPLIHHDIDQQLTALQAWQQQWLAHPAAKKPPGALAKLAVLRATQPQRIALAMPLHGRLGKVGQAVVDGFMAARFEAQQTLAAVPYVKIYDTTKVNDLDALYQQALADRIEMVIGPLDKDKVIQLSQKDALIIPTLALNYIPLGSSDRTPNNLVQFGLAVEDEALQLAARSFSEGHKRIIVLHQDQPWAARAAQHFSASWAELGGVIANQVSFSGAGDHSKTITEALLINQSHTRAKALKAHLAGSGNSIKFEPRRRQDVDAIVLFSLPTDGRQIIPTLAFHYAADLPVYASHHIYQGPTKTSRDRDLEKVIFTELPWLIEQPKIQQKISQKWPDRERYTRLFAMGVDAYRLFPRLGQLQAFANSRVHGVTGILQMNPQGRIFTQSSWGKFKAGKVTADPR